MEPHPQDGDEYDIEVIHRQEEENGDYSFTFIMTPKEES